MDIIKPSSSIDRHFHIVYLINWSWIFCRCLYKIRKIIQRMKRDIRHWPTSSRVGSHIQSESHSESIRFLKWTGSSELLWCIFSTKRSSPNESWQPLGNNSSTWSRGLPNSQRQLGKLCRIKLLIKILYTWKHSNRTHVIHLEPI